VSLRVSLRVSRLLWWLGELIAFAAGSLLLMASGFASVPPATKKSILVLYSERGDLPAIEAVEENMREVFHASASPQIELFSEYLDFARFPPEQYESSFVRYLQERYTGRQIDLVIPVAGFSLEFALGHRELFPGAPLVFCAIDKRELEKVRLPADATGIPANFDIERTVKLILQLQPGVPEIVCVSGTSGFDQRWAEETRKIMERFRSRVRARWITDKPLAETIDEVSRLPRQSAVLFVSMLRDGAGQSTSSVDAVRDLARVSKAPVYGVSSQFLEAGVVGGAMFDFGLNGRRTAELALKTLRGQWIPYGAPETESQNLLLVNWQALKKAQLPESLVPADAEVRLRPPGLWETHRTIILTVSGAIILQAVLIAGLVAERFWRRKAEASLRQSEERMSLAAEAANLGLWVWDVGRNEIWMTDKGRTLLGFTPDERIDYQALTGRVHPEDRAARDAAIKGALETKGEYAVEYRVVLPDGGLQWIGARGHCLNDGNTKGNRLLGVSMDVTEQKLAQDALRESEDRFRTLADTAPVMIWMSDTNKLCTYFNKGWLDFTGRSLEQQLGNGWAEGVHSEDLKPCLEVYVNSFDARNPFTMEYRLRRRDGEYRWVLDTGGPRFAPDGRFLGYIGSCFDITERKQAQDRFRLVVEGSPNGVVLVDAQSRIVLVNATVEKMFGYGREELIGQSIDLLVPELFRSEDPVHPANLHGAPVALAIGAEWELFVHRKDGIVFPVEIRLSHIQSQEGVLVLTVIVDISARKKAEAEARQYLGELTRFGRIEILGEMAASLAHELNQPLTGIMNNASAGRRFIAKGRANTVKIDSLLESVIADARRAGEIIRGIRAMVRKGEETRTFVNLNNIVAEVVLFVRSDAVERRCAIETDLDPKLPMIKANPVLLRQVLLNLIINAFDAMREISAPERRVIIRTECELGGSVRVSVRDFGTGLPSENPERIFEYFFSTKHDGLGIGLAIVRSIIASHGGEVAAVNAKDGGTCVYFFLPITQEVAA
jgi:two-component system, LuxR family, sensor kinase FixL